VAFVREITNAYMILVGKHEINLEDLGADGRIILK
jgi:hypothetical protein